MSGMYRNRIKGGIRRPRLWIQLAAAVLMNGYLTGFARGGVYTGPLKLVCVPVLNCYSCPGALGSCPIGGLQQVIGGSRHNVPLYVLGTLLLFGMVLGRLVCGLLCPFGLCQDLLHRIPGRKLRLPARLDHALRYLKYVILALFVVLLPLLVTDAFGSGRPWFCEYICPAGTLQGGIPQLILTPGLRQAAGSLFIWKMLVLVIILAAAWCIPRAFCRYLCPLGAIYALLQRGSLYRVEVSQAACSGCGRCAAGCPMGIEPRQQGNCGECIRCGRCRSRCPSQAIRMGFSWGDGEGSVRATKQDKNGDFLK